MHTIVEDQMFIDLVGDDDEVVFLRELGDDAQLASRVDLAGRIVRSIEQDHLRAAGDRGPEPVGVESPLVAVALQRDGAALGPTEGDAGRVGVVVGLEDHHLIAGSG